MIEGLLALDPRFHSILADHGEPEIWSRPPGFSTLALFILEQQVSLASARATFDRRAPDGVLTPDRVDRTDDAGMRAAGVSRQKIRYLRGLVEAVADGRLVFEELDDLPDDEARRRLTALTGVGPWTADVYLLACLGRPDVWPAGDRALQVSAAARLGLETVPDTRTLEQLGEAWRPYRSTAARLLWHAYLADRS